MLFDHDSPASLRDRAGFLIHHEVESGEDGALTEDSKSNSILTSNAKFVQKSTSSVSSVTSNTSPIQTNTSTVVAVDQFTQFFATEGRYFSITPEDIQKFDNNPENLRRYGGVSGVAHALKVNPTKGIEGSLEDINSRAQVFGTNTYPITKPKPFWDPKSGWFDGGGVFFAIILCLFVSSISDYKQSLQFQKLNAEKRKILVNVSRKERRTKIVIFDLLVGDIVHLGIGDQIPGDGLLVGTSSLVVDESSMTGESEPVLKDKDHPFLLSGCKVLDGTSTLMITAVGMSTEWGKVMATLSEENDEETPLQLRLNLLATTIGKIGMSVALVVFCVLLIRFLATEVDFKNFDSSDGRRIVDFFAVAVTIVVVAVPEGLPLAVTLTLAYSMHKMMEDRALVRHLSACETMGSATTICSDKTGTLTMNMMTVVNSWVCGKIRDPTILDKEFKDDVKMILFESICLNTNGHVHFPQDGGPEVTGSPTEMAVLNWGIKLGARFDHVKDENTILCVDSFNSTKKRMGVIIKNKDGGIWVHWKGASEVVLKQCNKIVDANGNISILTNDKMEELEGVINAFANAALRTLCLACRELNTDEIYSMDSRKSQVAIPDKDLTCIAIVGIKDPCRPGVPEAVQKCQLAGIKVRMVTGDNIMTAKAIAIECGILNGQGKAIEGKEFRNLSNEQQYKILPNLQVMARSSPTDKHTLVKRLLEMGEVVAVTGDGTNDAPALHEASIGLSMGIAGTEVAKESSDIIILDDNFSSIVKVVRWGRSVYYNIQKFIQFQCTVNGVALTLNFLSAISQGSAPLTAVQLLWVNLIMDTMGALALATEPPSESLMNKKPIGKWEPLITNIMWRNMIGQFSYQLSLLLVLQFRGKQILGLQDEAISTPSTSSKHGGEEKSYAEKELRTIIFTAFVFCQVFNEINSRKPDQINVFHNFLINRIFLYVVVFTLVVQILLVEFCGSFTSTVRISWKYWLICVAIGFLSMPLAMIVKFIPVPEKYFLNYYSKPKQLVFREGGTIKGVLIRGASQKFDLQRTKTARPSKFYASLEDEIKVAKTPSLVENNDFCQNAWQTLWPSNSVPSVDDDAENPSKRNSNIAWK